MEHYLVDAYIWVADLLPNWLMFQYVDTSFLLHDQIYWFSQFSLGAIEYIEKSFFQLDRDFDRLSRLYPDSKLWVDRTGENELGWWDEISVGKVANGYLIAALNVVSTKPEIIKSAFK